MQGLSELAAGHPLFSDLPADVVPYTFPFLLERESDLPGLKQEGIPLLRWEELAFSGCPTSERYMTRLVQIPCHQELGNQDVDWIVRTIKAKLG
jgi:hypothetical protein